MSRGSCLCGAVRYQVEEVAWVAHCHCPMCRKSHGAALVTWVGVNKDAFRITAGEDQVNWYESSPGAGRGACRICNSLLFFHAPRWPDEMHITRASFDEDIGMRPLAHAWYDRHVDWLTISDDLPRRGGPSGTEPLD
ncbi:GFA family protein [Gallaecimonas sp. GXIMD4217]|uniref:GFA family protein n=1 Tax=Gallaecimonas sp. GXIMD4217 TaxID=3131927 RepID=UPI00311ADA8A